MADTIGPILLPALEEEARLQADALYAGTYSSSSSSGDGDGGGGESALTLSTDPSRPGLGVDRWVSNGTDMIPVAVRYTLNYDVTGPSIRLYPTGLESPDPGPGSGSGGEETKKGKKKIAFKAMIEDTGAPDRAGRMFSTNCGTWVSQTAAVYADYPLDQFVFALGDDGRVESVVPLALRTPLIKER
ncbi:hypothetical protein F4802DRAFT_578271 [Xylaria palmicola]|nr:hypothetical protein F4802DRAFT_578271 [Xylaria palmicola]